MQFITPSFLQKGDTVAVLATARVVKKEAVEKAIKIIGHWGLKVIKGHSLYHHHQLFAGSDTQRLHDLQSALDDPSVRAIFCARGGYGTTRILDQIDWTAFKKQPKWICGFSDVTALLGCLGNLGYVSIHSTMPQLFDPERNPQDITSLRSLLFGDDRQKLTAPAQQQNQMGQSQGIMVGGNLSLLIHSIGTPSEIETAGRILCLEEVDEYQYEIDRMMTQLKRCGKLEDLAGVAVGHLTKIKEGDLSFGMDIRGVISHHINDHVPLAFDMPFGHASPNLALPFGMEGRISVTPQASELSF